MTLLINSTWVQLWSWDMKWIDKNLWNYNLQSPLEAILRDKVKTWCCDSKVKTWDRGNSSNCSDCLELSSKIKISVRLTLRQKLVKLQRQVETALFVPIWRDYLDVETFVGNCVRVSDDQVGDERIKSIKSFDLSSSRIWILSNWEKRWLTFLKFFC